MRDSAGVRVVENTRPLWKAQERLALAATPSLVLGDTTDTPYRFRRVRGLMRLADGRIAVVDGGSQQLRLFAADGRFVSKTAIEFEGSRSRADIGLVRRLHGDTIAISAGFWALSLYTPAGAFVRAVNLPTPDRNVTAATRILVDVLPDGRRLAAPMTRPARRLPGTRWVDSLSLAILAPSGAVDRSLGTVPYIEFVEDSTGAPTPPWLSPIGAFAVGDDRAYAGFGDRYAIRVYGGDGALRAIVQRSWTPVPVTSADWEQWVIEWSKRWVEEQGAAREGAIDAVRRSAYAAVLPAFSAFLVDRSGRLWVRGAHWQDAIGAGSLTDMPVVPCQWSVFDGEGRWLGDVEMPTNFKPYEIGADYVLGNALQAGVNRVVLYALRAGGS